MMKKIFPLIAVLAVILCGCNDRKSYTDLLNDENIAVNSFLANQRVEPTIPADSVFKTGADAPYYQLDEEGNIYMQVIDPGTPGDKVADGELVYFRFTRYNLLQYKDNTLPEGEGNATDITIGNTSFKYNDFSLESSYKWGSAIQMPLKFLPVDCQVNLVVKSQYGVVNEMANVTPFLYNIRYFKPQI